MYAIVSEIYLVSNPQQWWIDTRAIRRFFLREEDALDFLKGGWWKNTWETLKSQKYKVLESSY
jgi:hypothetical protein